MRRFASKTLHNQSNGDFRRINDLRIMGIHGDLVLCGIANKTLVIREGDIRWSCAVSLIVCNNFYTIILPYTNATRKKRWMNAVNTNEKAESLRVGGAKVNADSFRRHDESKVRQIASESPII